MEVAQHIGNNTVRCIMPVSYTHLDVYKRQVIPGPDVLSGHCCAKKYNSIVSKLSLIHIYYGLKVTAEALWRLPGAGGEVEKSRL